MLVEEQDKLRDDIIALVKKHGRERQALLPILHAIQRKHHHISDFAMNEIAEQLKLFPSEVQGVVTFYAFFNQKPKGKVIIRLCNGLSCKMAGSERIKHQLENDLGIKMGETTADGKFTLEETSCIGMCDLAPAMLLNETPFTQLNPETVFNIVKQFEASIGQEEI